MTSPHIDDTGTHTGTDTGTGVSAGTGPSPTASETTQAAVLAAVAAERRERPQSDREAADRADSYDAMMRLAGLLDDSGEELRQRSTLGAVITRGSSFVDSAPPMRIVG